MIDINSMRDKQIDNYRIKGALGKGGMGVVFTAIDVTLQRPVAIKFLPEEVCDDESTVKRFVREARSSARLNHPNIVTVYGVGRYKNTYYIAMELVEGLPLDALIRQEGKIPIERSVNLIRQAADALQEAHSQGIVHRDVKPQNMIVAKNDCVKIMDFGLAISSFENTQLTADGTSLGTPDYMSPEQWKDSKVDARSDVFSLGVTLFAMLTGKLPFAGSTPLAVMRKVMDIPAPDIRTAESTIPGEIAHIIDLMLQKDPQKRYPSAQAVSRDLSRFIDGLNSISTAQEDPFSAPGSEVMRSNMDKHDANQRSAPAIAPQPTEIHVSGIVSEVAPGESQSRPATDKRLVLGVAVSALFIALGATLFFLFPSDSNFVYIEPSVFLMGSPPIEVGRNDDESVHQVKLSKGFWISKYEVTQKEWIKIMGTNPSFFEGDDLPVERVSWSEVQEFIKRLSKKTSRQYRLPTEAEWEYAARAGSTSDYSFGVDSAELELYAWYGANSERTTHPVGSATPNSWGLYDMSGNVWEWCQDWAAPYQTGQVVDPTGPPDGTKRIGRGGSWSVKAAMCRSADRSASVPTTSGNDLGFRLVHD